MQANSFFFEFTCSLNTCTMTPSIFAPFNQFMQIIHFLFHDIQSGFTVLDGTEKGYGPNDDQD